MKFLPTYKNHLDWVDELTSQVDSHAPPPGTPADSFRADLAGLLSTAYVAAFECCIKAIFIEFAAKKHKILGSVAGFHFEKINSAIHVDTIAGKYAYQFGTAYEKAFRQRLKQEEQAILASHKVSMTEAYTNLVKWRHAFAHEGKKLATLEEVKKALPLAKKVIHILDDAMSI